MKIVITLLVLCFCYYKNYSQLAWNQIPNIFNGDVKSLIQFNSNTVFVGTTGGIFYSNDTGNTWQASDLQAQTIIGITNSLDSTIFAINEKGVLFTSTNKFNWEIIPNNLPTIPIKQLVNQSEGNLYALLNNDSIYVSNDKGKTWSLSMSGLQDIRPNYLVTNELGNIYSATSFGVFTLINNGQNWVSASNQLPFQHTSYMYYNQSVGILYAYSNQTNQVVFRQQASLIWELVDTIPNLKSIASDNQGNTYVLIKDTLLHSTNNGLDWVIYKKLSQLSTTQTVQPISNNKILLGTKNNGIVSINSKTIKLQNNGLLNANINSLILQDSTSIYLISNQNQLLKSIDKGQNWQTVLSVSSPDTQLFQVLMTSNKILYLTTSIPNTLLRSKNQGVNWDTLRNVIKDTSQIYLIKQIHYNPKNDTLTIVNQFNTIFQAKDSSLNFIHKNNNLPLGERYFLLNSENKLLTTSNLGIYTLNNVNNSWQPFGNIQPNEPVLALAINKNNTLVAISNKTVYLLTNNNWIPIYQPINNISLTTVIIDDSGTIFVGTNQNSIFYAKAPYINWQNNHINLPQTITINNLIINYMNELIALTQTNGIYQSEPTLRLFQNIETQTAPFQNIKIYPNPFDNQINIAQLQPNNQPITVNILNSLGQLIIQQLIPENTTHFIFPTNNLKSNNYILQLIQNQEVINKLILIKP